MGVVGRMDGMYVLERASLCGGARGMLEPEY